MLSSFDPRWQQTLDAQIQRLERTELDSVVPDEFDPQDLFDEQAQTFLVLRGMADFWSYTPGIDFIRYLTDLVMGAHHQPRAGLTLVVAGTPARLAVYISLGDESTTRTMLEGIFPGIELDPKPITRLATYLNTHFQVQGMLTGIPGRKDASTPQSSSLSRPSPMGQQASQQGHSAQHAPPVASPLERVIRGMYQATWVYAVKAFPCPRSKVTNERMQYLDLLAQIASQTRIQLQETKADSKQRSESVTSSSTQTLSGEKINYRAQYLVQLLEHAVTRLDQAAASGWWTVESYFGASTLKDARRLSSLLTGTLSGSDSRPDPMRAYLCDATNADRRSPGEFITYLTSEEVATLIQLPREEVPGYAIHDFVTFDTDFMPPINKTTIALGHIQQHSHDIQDTFNITIDDLAKHAVVVGVTGSGKTTTVMNLLDRLVNANVPFLIIEPAKTEYRAMRRALANRQKLRIYTLGDDTTAPFRLNPFECESDDNQDSLPLLNHIDFLKAVFNAAFVLYAPMPYVLETALHEVYEDKGWDIATGMNMRLPDWKERQRYPVFPTLTDLYHKIEAVTNRLRYDQEIEQNIKAGLKARIGAMRLGAKGLMLDTARGIPMQQLLVQPTLLELENIGSDEEKTFLMGLLLAKLYEYRRLHAGAYSGRLQHLLVFEEAHRLLKNTSTQVDTESSNMRAQAIEVFTNMLSEIRAYGQGVLVAEQIPSKLAPDVLKNTNLKIVHRLIAQDDRESIGQTMNLNTEQKMHLGILKPGMAAIFAEGADHAYLVRLDDYKQKMTHLGNAELKQISSNEISVKAYQAIPDIDKYLYSSRPTPFGGPDPFLYRAAGTILEHEQSRKFWATILLRIVYHPDGILAHLQTLRQTIEHELPSLPTEQSREAVWYMSIVRGCATTLAERGAFAGWNYPLMERLRLPLTQGLMTLIRTQDLTLASRDLDAFARLYDAEQRKRKRGPFAGCEHCDSTCTFRAEVRHLLSPSDARIIDDELTSSAYASDTDRYKGVAKTAQGLARRWLNNAKQTGTDLAYCGALHAAQQSGYNEYEQKLFAERLKPFL